jgi:eukaryotic-like serine/threonine-protein kinase
MNLKEFLKTKPVLANISLVIIFFLVLSYFSLLFLKIYTHHGQSLVVPDYKGLSHKEVVSLSKKKNLRYQIIDSIYILEAIPGSVIEQYPSPGDKVKQKRIIYLTIASVTPEFAPIPKVIDVSLREAQSRLENSGFKIGSVIYRPSEFKNLVLEQRYQNKILPVGKMLPKGTPVDLIVGKGLSSELATVPVLFGLSLDDARSRLYDLNLNTGALIYDNTVITSYDSMNARVWKQSPDSLKATSVEQGTSFDLWLTNEEKKLNPVSAEDSIINIEEL